MKKDIHPEYFEDAKITCVCGASYAIGSTVKEIQVELCAAGHPFYTGTKKIVDSARRVEKFHARTARKATASVKAKKEKKTRRAATKIEKTKKNAAKEA